MTFCRRLSVRNPGWRGHQIIDRSKTKSTLWGVASTGQVAREGTVSMVERWDGSVDATVCPQPIRLRLRAGVDSAALEDYKQATRDLAAALRSQDQQWIARAQRRWETTRIHVEDQGD